MNETDVLALVKEQTRPQHDRLERLLPFTRESLSLSSYRDLLISFLGLFDPIERTFTRTELPKQLEADKRMRLPLLLRDLRSLGLNDAEIERLPRCSAIPSSGTTAQTLGVMYVLEGSTLGGQFISKVVNERLGLTDDSGCAFFSSHGRDVGAMWRRFCEVVRQEVVGSGPQQEFILSARSTFALFEKWVERENPAHE